MRTEHFFFGNPFESEFDSPPGFMGGVAVQEQEQEEQEQTLNIDAYLDALREGTGDYTSTLQTDLVDQGYLPDVTVIGEGGAYGTEFDPESAMASVPVGSLENYDFGSFTFDKNLEDFGGTFGYGNLTNEQLQSFQNELLPIMAKEVAKQQTEGRQDYQSALMKAYQFNPEVQAVYEKYGVSPIRTSDQYGSVKLYDPFSFNEITLTDNRPGFDEYAAPAIKAFISWATGQALGQLAGAAGDALFGDVPLFGEEIITTGVDAAGNPIYNVDTSGVTTIGDIIAGATSTPTADTISGIAGPVNMLTGALAIKDAVDTAQTTEDAPDWKEERLPAYSTEDAFILDVQDNVFKEGMSFEEFLEAVNQYWFKDRQELKDWEIDLGQRVLVRDLASSAYDRIPDSLKEKEVTYVQLGEKQEEPTDTTEKAVRPDEPEEVGTPPETPLDVITDDVTLDDALEAIEVDDFEEDIAPPAIDIGEIGGSESSSAAEAAEAQEGQEGAEAPPAEPPAAPPASPPPPPPPPTPPPPPPPPSASGGMFTQKQVDDLVSAALSGATSGLFTAEEVEEAKQTVLDNLPEDTTLFDQGDIDAAVQKAVSEVEADFSAEQTGLESTIEGLEGELEAAGTAIEGLETNLETAETALEAAQTTASSLQTELNSANEAIANQTGTIAAQTESIQTLESSVTTLEGTIDSLNTKLTEVTNAKDAAIEAGNTALSEAIEAAETTLQNTISEAATTLENAIAAGETNVAAAVEAGQNAVDAAVAAGNAAVEAAEAAGATAVSEAEAAGKSATAEAVAAGEAATAEAVAAGEAAAKAAEAAGKEEGFGEGFGEGLGEGTGVGTGVGLASGLALGMLMPGQVTRTMFEDLEFKPMYQAPEELQRATVYQTPQATPSLFRNIIG